MLRDYDHNLVSAHVFFIAMLTPTDSHCSPIHITESANSSTSLVRGLMGLMGIIISQQYCVFFFLVELDNAPTFCYKNLFSEGIH